MKEPLFFSGPHGGGKTTLIKKLALEIEGFKENMFDIDFLTEFKSIRLMNDFERCLLRLYHRIYIMNYIRNNSAQSDFVQLVSRSVYDSFAYIDTYFEIGEINSKQYGLFEKIKENLDYYPKTVILNPSLDLNLERLENRRRKGERKERDRVFRKEDTRSFLQILHNNFAKYKTSENVLYLENNTEQDINKIKKWLVTYSDEEGEYNVKI